jgi:hypothetical protein
VDDMARHGAWVLVVPPSRRPSGWRLATRAKGETPSGQPAGCRRYDGIACRTTRAVAMPGFRGRPWGPQENASLGTALDPKLEPGRPRALPALESRGFCARTSDG